MSYKNILQEYCVVNPADKPLGLPTYSTTQITDPKSNLPSFKSTVTLSNGKKYTGEQQRTKKAAESSAANAAYLALTNPAHLKSSTLAVSGASKTKKQATPHIQRTQEVEEELVLYKPPIQSKPKTSNGANRYVILIDLENRALIDRFTPEMKLHSLGVYSRSSVSKFDGKELGIKTIKMESVRKDASDTLIVALATKMAILNEQDFIIILTGDNFAANVGEAIFSMGYRTPVYHAVDIGECNAIIQERVQ
jgi:hypothetical protein